MGRLLGSDDPRWCLAVGAAIGLGMLTKYTMMFLVGEITRNGKNAELGISISCDPPLTEQFGTRRKFLTQFTRIC
jgi:hypothetical protein